MSLTRTDKNFLSKIAVARQLLREKSEEILQAYMETIAEARANKDYETAAKALQWLIEHMPADEAGGKLVDRSVDKQADVAEKGPTGPTIQIGIQVGGLQKNLPTLPKPKEITGEVIDAD